MRSVGHARPDTEGERRTSTSQQLVTHRDRVVHRFAQSGVASRCVGVQSLGYGPGPYAERVIESRFEAVISMHSADSSGRRNTSMMEVFLGGAEGFDEWSAAVGRGSGVATGDAFTGAPRAVAGGAVSVLASDRPGLGHGGCWGGGRRVDPGRDEMVSSRWRDAADQSGRAL